jgi:hypothetical protein
MKIAIVNRFKIMRQIKVDFPLKHPSCGYNGMSDGMVGLLDDVGIGMSEVVIGLVEVDDTVLVCETALLAVVSIVVKLGQCTITS